MREEGGGGGGGGGGHKTESSEGERTQEGFTKGRGG